jgi:hypothetical protein
MKIAVLGTGMVGQALASKLLSLGHQVMMGGREAKNDKAEAWAKAAGPSASYGTFAEAAAFGDMAILATLGSASLAAAKLAGNDLLKGKVLIDVTNPLDFSKGMPPILIPELSNSTSLGEEIQKALPDVHVVKALNTMSNALMINPALVPGEHDVFVCGDDPDAKAKVMRLLNSFGWAKPMDLGPLSASRGTEVLMLFWLRMWGVLGTSEFNYRIVSARR